MPKFRASFLWAMTCSIEIEAENEDDALIKADAAAKNINLDRDGTSVSDTFDLVSIDACKEECKADKHDTGNPISDTNTASGELKDDRPDRFR